MTYLIVSYVCMAILTSVIFAVQTQDNLKKRKEIYEQCYGQWKRENRSGEFEKHWLYERYENNAKKHDWEISGWMILATVFAPVTFPVAIVFGIIVAALAFSEFILSICERRWKAIVSKEIK